jgi:hypothetical protein
VSSLTGASAQQLADEYTANTGKQWTQFVGFVCQGIRGRALAPGPPA